MFDLYIIGLAFCFEYSKITSIFSKPIFWRIGADVVLLASTINWALPILMQSSILFRVNAV